MTERKVASRQERLMFEQLIRQDMQYGIQRTIDNNSPTPNNYNNKNQNQERNQNSNYNNPNQNNPQTKLQNSKLLKIKINLMKQEEL